MIVAEHSHVIRVFIFFDIVNDIAQSRRCDKADGNSTCLERTVHGNMCY